MKLSKSKLALAKVINENGGWGFDIAFAAQDKDGDIDFYVRKPKRIAGRDWWETDALVNEFRILTNVDPVKNWHQTCLSREEYYHAYQKTDADGWIEWSGVAKSPAGKGVAVDVKMKNGTQHFGQLIDDECWGDHWGDASIIAYRLHKPEVNHEFCESVTHSIPEPETNPTIEQLARDYRNAKDYADRLQKEAGEAAVKAEEFAVEIRKKILELQELIKTSKPEQEQELVIADWRDLQKGDIIWWSGDSKYSSGEYQVHDIEEHCHTGSCAILLDVGDCCRQWIDHDDEDWKFIRRS